MNDKFKLYVFDKGYLLSPPVHLNDDEANQLHRLFEDWDGRDDVLVSAVPIEVVDLRRGQDE